MKEAQAFSDMHEMSVIKPPPVQLNDLIISSPLPQEAGFTTPPNITCTRLFLVFVLRLCYSSAFSVGY